MTSVSDTGEPIELGVAYRHADGDVVCAACGYECEWEECYANCEDGYFDGYEEDPLWYDPGELVPCNECNARGGSFWCINRECKTGEIIRFIKTDTPQ